MASLPDLLNEHVFSDEEQVLGQTVVELGRAETYLLRSSTHHAGTHLFIVLCNITFKTRPGARCSSVVRAFAHGFMGRRIDPSWGGPIELFLVPASAPQLV